MEYPIVFEKQSLEKDTRNLFSQLGDHNKKLNPQYEYQRPFGFFIKNKNQILGGVSGYVWLGAIRIDRIFVEEKLRGKGYGKKLLYRAEDYGRDQGASVVSLENLSFQKTLNFYIKQGYFIAYQEQAHPHDTIIYHLRKKLT